MRRGNVLLSVIKCNKNCGVHAKQRKGKYDVKLSGKWVFNKKYFKNYSKFSNSVQQCFAIHVCV